MAVAAPAAFRAAPDSATAADIVGAMLIRWHYIALVLPLLVFALVWKRARAAVIVVIFIGIVLAALQAMVDVRIRHLRASSIVPISDLPRADPLRRRFGLLHGGSSLLLLLQAVAAGTVVAAGTPRHSTATEESPQP